MMLNSGMSPIERAIESAGGLTELARKIGVATPQVVANWRTRKSVPPEYCIPVEEATDGEVTRHDLRPDIFGDPPKRRAVSA